MLRPPASGTSRRTKSGPRGIILRSDTAPRYTAPTSDDAAHSPGGGKPDGYAAGRRGRRTPMGITTRLPAPPGAGARPAREWPGEQPPDEISRGLFGQSRRLMRTHPLATDMLLVALLLASCSLWLAWSALRRQPAAIVQTALIIVLVGPPPVPVGGLPGRQRHRAGPVAARLPAARGRGAAGRAVHGGGSRVADPRPARHRPCSRPGPPWRRSSGSRPARCRARCCS